VVLVVHLPHVADVAADVLLPVLSLVSLVRQLILKGVVPHPVIILSPFTSRIEIFLEEADLRVLIDKFISLGLRKGELALVTG